eukprot:11150129-Karenia_brevis.AAC.1
MLLQRDREHAAIRRSLGEIAEDPDEDKYAQPSQPARRMGAARQAWLLRRDREYAAIRRSLGEIAEDPDEDKYAQPSQPASSK